MFCVRCRDGENLWSIEGNQWDSIKHMIDEHGGIESLTLTNGHSVQRTISNADGYHYHQESVARKPTNIPAGSFLHKVDPPSFGTEEEIAGYYSPKTFVKRYTDAVETIANEKAEIILKDTQVAASDVEMIVKDQSHNQAQILCDQLDATLTKLHDECKRFPNGAIVIYRLTMIGERFAVGDDPDRAPVQRPTTVCDQSPESWIGVCPDLAKYQSDKNGKK